MAGRSIRFAAPNVLFAVAWLAITFVAATIAARADDFAEIEKALAVTGGVEEGTLVVRFPRSDITVTIFGALGRRDLSEQAEYTFKNAGLFLEAGLESTFPVGFFNCTLWAKGNWLSIRGDGDVNLAGQSSAFVLFFRLPEPFTVSSSGTSTLSQYTFDVGFSGAINF